MKRDKASIGFDASAERDDRPSALDGSKPPFRLGRSLCKALEGRTCPDGRMASTAIVCEFPLLFWASLGDCRSVGWNAIAIEDSGGSSSTTFLRTLRSRGLPSSSTIKKELEDSFENDPTDDPERGFEKELENEAENDPHLLEGAMPLTDALSVFHASDEVLAPGLSRLPCFLLRPGSRRPNNLDMGIELDVDEFGLEAGVRS